MRTLFHLAMNVTDLDQARAFYGGMLGCSEGRSTDSWVDFNFFGHQLTLHLGVPFPTAKTGKVGEYLVPMPHLGVVLELSDWQNLATHLQEGGQEFVIEPVVRFEGQAGQQYTMFFTDPCGNPIEIKGFDSLDKVWDV